MKALTIACLASLALWFIGTLAAGEGIKPSAKPQGGLVPDEATAIKIAVAVWEPIYGAEHIAGEKPYRAKLAKGVWTVQGSLPSEHTRGGVALAEIAKSDGSILRVIHGK